MLYNNAISAIGVLSGEFGDMGSGEKRRFVMYGSSWQVERNNGFARRPTTRPIQTA